MLNETLAEKNILICIFPKSSQRKMYKILKRPYLLTKSWYVFFWISTLHIYIYIYGRFHMSRNVHLETSEAPTSHRLVKFYLYGNNFLEGPPML